jgi:hypothetical protein
MLSKVLKDNLGYLQRSQRILLQKILVFTLTKTLNNYYCTVSLINSRVLVTQSSGQLTTVRKTTKQALTTLLLSSIQLSLSYLCSGIVLKLCHTLLPYQALFKLLLKKFAIRVLYLTVSIKKAFNGVRSRKQRRL